MSNLIEQAQAVFEPHRLQIIKLLQTRTMCVCELAAVLGLSSPRISQHLAVLRRAGIVREKRAGKWIYYSLGPKGLTELQQSWESFLNTPLEQHPALRPLAARLAKLNPVLVEDCLLKQTAAAAGKERPA